MRQDTFEADYLELSYILVELCTEQDATQRVKLCQQGGLLLGRIDKKVGRLGRLCIDIAEKEGYVGPDLSEKMTAEGL